MNTIVFLPLRTKRSFLRVTGVSLAGILLFSLVLLFPPVHAAGWTYLDPNDEPHLSASPSGDTRYYPGDSFNLTVIITNRGRDTSMQAAPLLSPGIYDPSTALGVTVRPENGSAPVTLKSLPEVPGTIGSLGQLPVVLRGTVHRNAAPGVYTIPLNITYQYVYAIPMAGSAFSSVDMLYREKTATLMVPIRIESELQPEILSENATNLVPGTQGYLTVTLQNTGYATGTEVSLGIIPEDPVTFQMVDQSVSLGTFRPGNITSFKARIAVKEHTGAGSYPAVLVGQYRDGDGIFRNMTEVPLGIPVGKGAVLEVVSRNFTVSPGGTKSLEVVYRNSGDTPAYHATARIIGNQILVPVTDSAELGTLHPNETGTAFFSIGTDAAIPGKQYVIQSEVKYRDSLDALMLSDALTFGVRIKEPAGIAAITHSPVALILIAGVLIILGYIVRELIRNKRKGSR